MVDVDCETNLEIKNKIGFQKVFNGTQFKYIYLNKSQHGKALLCTHMMNNLFKKKKTKNYQHFQYKHSTANGQKLININIQH